MTDVYWLTFRIAHQGNYQERYEDLQEAVRLLTNRVWWVEPTSFIAFASDESIDEIADTITWAIDVDRDVILIGMRDYKSMRVIGRAEDDDLFKLFPSTKKR
jgi:hypothetical protein